MRREAAQLPPPGCGSPRAGGPDLGVYVTGADSGPAGSPKRSLRRGASKSLEIKVKKPFLLLSNYSVWVGERRVEEGAVGVSCRHSILRKHFDSFPLLCISPNYGHSLPPIIKR